MRTVCAVALVISLVVTFVSQSRGNTPTVQARQAANRAAEAWLKLVDSGKYGESWDTAATYFKNAVDKSAWERQIRAVRAPLGKVLSRELKEAEYRTSLPGAPDGEYVVIQFNTSFENKKSAVETITPMLGKDGEWRVSGYYIR